MVLSGELAAYVVLLGEFEAHNYLDPSISHWTDISHHQAQLRQLLYSL